MVAVAASSKNKAKHRKALFRMVACFFVIIIVLTGISILNIAETNQRVQELSLVDSYADIEAKYVFARRDQQPVWVWTKYPHHKHDKESATKRVLISQYYGKRDPILLKKLTFPMNKAYANKFGHDYLKLLGNSLTGPEEVMKKVRDQHHTYNKIEILLEALHLGYDILLILDADAMIIDFENDISTMIPNEALIMADKIRNIDGEHTAHINTGVTLWNLRHNLAEQVAVDWKKEALEHIQKGTEDMGSLQTVLTEHGDAYIQTVFANPNAFHGHEGTIVKHYSKSNIQWNETRKDFERVMNEIRRDIRRLCNKYDMPKNKAC